MSSTVNRIAAVGWMLGWSLFVYRAPCAEIKELKKNTTGEYYKKASARTTDGEKWERRQDRSSE